MNIPDNINKLHFIYFSIISVIVIGFFGGISFYYSNSIVNIFSISSALISIVIGTLAIFFAAYQGLTQGTSIQKLNESVERVEKATKKLDNVEEMKNQVSNLHQMVYQNQQFNIEGFNNNDEPLELSKDHYMSMFLYNPFNLYFTSLFIEHHTRENPFYVYEYLDKYLNNANLKVNTLNENVVFGMFLSFIQTILSASAISIEPVDDKPVLIHFYITDIEPIFLEAFDEMNNAVK